MKKVKLTITESCCRSGHFRKGQEFIVDDLCPPLCHELWNIIYPYVFALQNGAELDHGEEKARAFDAVCPDGGRVKIHGEVIEDR
ncbi:MAG: TIGR04076 family protein [Clostridiales bacterium]|jgi:TIGR04076 family protein|nr:TIGR04076 family protein [Clostridiales bacterium]